MGPLLGYYSEDPLHMNRDGYRVLGKSVAEYLSELESRSGDLRVRPAKSEPALMLPAEVADDAAGGDVRRILTTRC